MKLLLTLALLLPMAAHAQLTKSLVGFQGMPWGSTMGAVKAKFPRAKEIDYCKAFDKLQGGGKGMRQRYQEEDTNCVHLLIENYNVSSDVAYDLAFYFNQAGRLEQVNLGKYIKQDGNPGYLTDCTALFDRTNTLLTINYGPGVVPSNINEIKGAYNNVAAKLWVPMPTEIILKRQWGYKFPGEQSFPDFCQISVVYTKRGVDKL
jgi:hypothetical protein